MLYRENGKIKAVFIPDFVSTLEKTYKLTVKGKVRLSVIPRPVDHETVKLIRLFKPEIIQHLRDRQAKVVAKPAEPKTSHDPEQPFNRDEYNREHFGGRPQPKLDSGGINVTAPWIAHSNFYDMTKDLPKRLDRLLNRENADELRRSLFALALRR